LLLLLTRLGIGISGIFISRTLGLGGSYAFDWLFRDNNLVVFTSLHIALWYIFLGLLAVHIALIVRWLNRLLRLNTS
jgi:hypothetical protein